MQGFSTIQLDRSVIAKLKEYKTHPRQPYNEVILQLIDEYCMRRGMKTTQRIKMKELWDNKEDEEFARLSKLKKG